MSISDISAIQQINSGPGWEPELIQQFIREVAEGPLFDRKSHLPIIHCKPGEIKDATVELTKTIREFVRDCISMLNSARRRGKPAYIVYGVKDNWEIMPSGIFGKSTRKMSNTEIESYLDTPKLFQDLQRNVIEKYDMRPHTERLIWENPSAFIHYEFGWINHEGEKVFLSYLVFEPYASQRPFAVKPSNKGTEIWYERLNLTPGESWSRVGESKKEFVGAEIDTLVCWRESPFVSSEQWSKYLTDLQQKISRICQYNIHEDELGLQRLTAKDSYTNDLIGLNAALHEFATYTDTGNQVLFVLGDGGVGKSTQVQLLTLEVARLLQEEIKDAPKKYDQPEGLIPVYVEMKRFRCSTETPLHYIASTLQSIKIDADIEKIFGDRELQFLFILDAIDEMASDEHERNIDAIYQLVKDYAHIKFIIVSRPSVFQQNILERHRYLRVLPLTLEQIVNCIKAAEISIKVQEQLIDLISGDLELQSLLGVPRMLTACINGVAKLEHVSLGTILHAAIEEHLRYDIEKLPKATYKRDYRLQLEQFVENFWENDRVYVDKSKQLEYYEPLLQNGLLRENERKVYFASRYIVDYLLARQIHDNEDFRNRVKLNIDPNPDQPVFTQYQINRLRLLANWCESDLSNVGTNVGRWINHLTDPKLILQIYKERLQPFVENTENLCSAIVALSAADVDAKGLVFDFLQDASFEVFQALLDTLRAYPQLQKLVEQKDIELLFSNTIEQTRQNLLLRFIVDIYGLSLEDLFDQKFSESQPDIDLLIGLLDQFDWSQAVPEKLMVLNILGTPVFDDIRLEVLNKLLAHNLPIPAQWQAELKGLKMHQNQLIRKKAAQLLGEPIEIEAEATDEAQLDTVEAFDPQVLRQLQIEGESYQDEYKKD